jgi:hypothetical protein
MVTRGHRGRKRHFTSRVAIPNPEGIPFFPPTKLNVQLWLWFDFSTSGIYHDVHTLSCYRLTLVLVWCGSIHYNRSYLGQRLLHQPLHSEQVYFRDTRNKPSELANHVHHPQCFVT